MRRAASWPGNQLQAMPNAATRPVPKEQAQRVRDMAGAGPRGVG